MAPRRSVLVSLRRHRAAIVDVVVAVVLAGLLLANLRLADQIAGLEAIQPVGGLEYLLAAMATLPLALRRPFPTTALVMVAAGAFALIGRVAVNLALPHLAVLFAVYNLGAHGRPVVRDVVRGLVLGVGLWWFAMTEVPPGADDPRVYYSFGVALYLAMYGVAWVAGEHARLRGERERELAARTVELELERARHRQQAMTEERLRIAREIHDVLGHHVSVMGVQAAGAKRVIRTDPERATAALDAIEHASRRAVTELQQVLTLLREDRDEGEDRPLHAGAGGLDELLREVRQAGVEVTLHAEELPELAAAPRLAVLRVVQEALTNVLRHAGPGTSAWVHLACRDGELRVRVDDDGRGTRHNRPGQDGGQDGWGSGSGPKPGTDSRPDAGSGKGLLGLQERLALHGGELQAGPQQPSGFRVSARLPLASDDAPSPVLEELRR